MSNLASLVPAVAIMIAVLAALAIIRRFMLSRYAPRWLATNMIAFALAFAITIVFALSLFNVANALQPHIPSVVIAGLLSAAMHVTAWAVIRVIIPVGRGGADHTPHTDLTGGGAVPTAA